MPDNQCFDPVQGMSTLERRYRIVRAIGDMAYSSWAELDIFDHSLWHGNLTDEAQAQKEKYRAKFDHAQRIMHMIWERWKAQHFEAD